MFLQKNPWSIIIIHVVAEHAAENYLEPFKKKMFYQHFTNTTHSSTWPYQIPKQRPPLLTKKTTPSMTIMIIKESWEENALNTLLSLRKILTVTKLPKMKYIYRRLLKADFKTDLEDASYERHKQVIMNSFHTFFCHCSSPWANVMSKTILLWIKQNVNRSIVFSRNFSFGLSTNRDGQWCWQSLARALLFMECMGQW